MATAIPSKSKSGLSEGLNHKTTPSTPRVSKLGRAGSVKSDSDSPSSLQNPRSSVDRSPRSVDSKLTVERRSPKITTPDKQARPLKASELQAQLSAIQEELKKAKERAVSFEKEKARVLEELKDAKRLADETNEKLKEALLAQKKAEESSEIEKFRADELEQSGIEAAQKREEDGQKEIESIRNQHALDVATLLSTTQELQRVKQELMMTCDAKNTALSHADDAMKIAEINADKVELLSGEISRLKLRLDSQLESKSNEAKELVEKLDSEVAELKHELVKARAAEQKLVEMEALVEGLKVELAEAKRNELDANNLVEEGKKNEEMLRAQLEEADQSEKSIQDSLASMMRELEERKSLLSHAESEIASLQGKVEILELEMAKQKEDLDESDRCLDVARQEALEIRKMVEVLKTELQQVEEEKMQALSNEKLAASNLESLSEENNKLVIELGITRDEGEKVKKAMEDLTLALHEVSTEAREAQERFLAKQAEVENTHAQIEELELSLKSSNENYEVMLDEAKYEIVCLKRSVEKSEMEAENSKAEWDSKELNFMSAIKRSEDEVASIKVEMDTVVEALKVAENEAQDAKEDGVQLLSKLRQAEIEAALANETMEGVKAESLQLKERLLEKENELQSISEAAKNDTDRLVSKLKQVESEAIVANEVMEEVKAESSLLKERLLDKENELQSITQENDDLRTREAAALEKIRELSALLAEATAKKTEENGKHDLSASEREQNSPPKMTESPKETASESDTEKPKLELPSQKVEESFREETKLKIKEENGNGNTEEEKVVDVDKDLSSEREHEAESVDDESDSKVDCGSLDQTNGVSMGNVDNGATSPTKQQQQQKKKKALLQKFGSLLKKKSNHK